MVGRNDYTGAPKDEGVSEEKVKLALRSEGVDPKHWKKICNLKIGQVCTVWAMCR